jgi:hypothetical protein
MRSCEKPHQRVRDSEFIPTPPGEPVLATPSCQQPAGFQATKSGEDTAVSHMPRQSKRIRVLHNQPEQAPL